ncbi:MAG: hypothetical protein QXY26_09670 [Ignisphaera sp.]|uniref:Uncharacterized protein n=1 Tax=Ignisphaera aggregans TaxID=334771 RepID=A0A7J3I783_9CREN
MAKGSINTSLTTAREILSYADEELRKAIKSGATHLQKHYRQSPPIHGSCYELLHQPQAGHGSRSHSEEQISAEKNV